MNHTQLRNDRQKVTQLDPNTIKVVLCRNQMTKALRASFEGHGDMSADPDFVFDMRFFGYAEQSKGNRPRICYGCFAAVTTQRLSGLKFTPEAIGDRASRAKFMSVTVPELGAFEESMSALAEGNVAILESFFGLPLKFSEGKKFVAWKRKWRNFAQSSYGFATSPDRSIWLDLIDELGMIEATWILTCGAADLRC